MMPITAKADYLLSAIDVLTAICDKESVITIEMSERDRNLRTKIMNSEHSAYCSIEIQCELAIEYGFVESFEFSETKEIQVQLDRLISALKFFGASTITVSESDNTITIDGYDAKRQLRTVDNIESVKDYNSEDAPPYLVTTQTLKMVQDFSSISDYLTITYDNEQITISVKSETESASIRLKNLLDEKSTEYAQVVISTDMFNSIIKKIKWSDMIYLYFGVGTVLDIFYDHDGILTTISLAPRITAEESQ